MAPRRAKDIVMSAPPVDHEDLMRKRDAFVTSMAMLQNAANEASRAGLAYFDLVAHGVPIGIGMNGEGMHYARAMSLPPGRAMTEEPEYDGLKRKRKRSAKPKDPNAPKKPATPFFLFCSEGRATVKSDMGEGTEFRDIQAELKRRWEELPIEEKRAWSELYQTKLAEWKKTIEVYQHGKEAAQQLVVQAEEHDEDDEDEAEDAVAPAAGFSAPVAGFSALVAGFPAPAAAVPTAVAPAAAVPTAAAGGFTAVNHAKNAAVANDSDSEDEPEPEVELEPEVEEPAEQEDKPQRVKEHVDASDSSLTPLPTEKPKRGRKPKSRNSLEKAVDALPETPTSDKKSRKPRSKKVKEAEEDSTPRRNARKRRKSGTE